MLCNKKETINIKRGSKDIYTLTFRDFGEEKVVDPITGKLDYPRIDITGYEIYVTFRKESTLNDPNDSTIAIDKTAVITDAPNGVADVSLSEVDTDITPGEYVGAISYKDLTAPINNQFSEQVGYIYLVIEKTVKKDH